MAITTRTDPSGYPSLNDNLWHIAKSDKSDEPNFKFVFDIHDPSGVQYIRSKVYPDPTTERGYFDAGPIIRNTVKVSWFNPVNAFVTSTPNISGQIGKIYHVRVGEEYSSGGVILTNLNLSSGSVTAYNYFPNLWNSKPGTDISQKFNDYLTNRPMYMKIPYSLQPVMIPFHSMSNLSVIVNVFQYSYSKQQIGWPGNTFSFTKTASGNGFYQLNISPAALVAEISGDIDFYESGYYTVQINNKLIRVDFDCKPQYTPIQLYFVNAYGMYDMINFNLVNKLSLKTTRKSYQQDGYTYGNSAVNKFESITGGAKKWNETKINYNQNVDWTYKLMLESPTDAEFDWLSELIYSPLIYMKIGTNFYPVTISTTNHEYARYQWAKLRNFEIDVEVNQSRKGIGR